MYKPWSSAIWKGVKRNHRGRFRSPWFWTTEPSHGLILQIGILRHVPKKRRNSNPRSWATYWWDVPPTIQPSSPHWKSDRQSKNRYQTLWMLPTWSLTANVSGDLMGVLNTHKKTCPPFFGGIFFWKLSVILMQIIGFLENMNIYIYIYTYLSRCWFFSLKVEIRQESWRSSTSPPSHVSPPRNKGLIAGF